MDQTPNIDEQELIEAGRRLLTNGQRPSYVYTYIRDRVADPEQRKRILDQVLGQGVRSESGDGDKEHERNLRKARHLWEDYIDAVNGIQKSINVCIVLMLAMAVSTFLFGADNSMYVIATIVGIAYFWVARKVVEWEEKRNALVVAGFFLALVVVEVLVLGLPENLIPQLGVQMTRRHGLATLANAISSYVYIGVKAAAIFPVLAVFRRRSLLDALPERYRRSVGA